MSISLPVVTDLVDGFARRINYLRLSLTDRCNYRCTYCMPEEMVFRRRAELLSFEEIARVVRIFAGLGVERVRLTGGEPLVRQGVVELVALLAAIPTRTGAPMRLAMTSNGHLLPELAQPLASAGLGEVNISIDTLDSARFREITRRGELEKVVAGIDAAVAAGLRVKLNAVALRGLNDGPALVELCRFAWDRGVVPRFIEHMPMSDGQIFDSTRQIDAAEIRAAIASATGETLEACASGPATGPARYWRVGGDSARRFGIISAMSEHFCDSCNRLRVSATGDLHACLAFDDAASLRDIMRRGGSDHDVTRLIEATVSGKRVGHEFQASGHGAPSKHMISIGG